jgi:peptidoglycan/LPS O-acetylase OafA/YrhL
LAVVFAIAAIAMGIGMAAAHDHSAMPAHAHLNLLGRVSLFLFGIYYKPNPQLERSRIALTPIAVWSLGTVVLTIAVAAIHLGYEATDPIAAVASFIVLAGMLLFGYLVFRPASSDTLNAMVRMTPAE